MALTLGIVLVVVAALVVFIAARPSTFRVARSAVIAAPPQVVFAQLDDFHRWAAWSPWEKLDPGMTKSFDGPASGVGAGYRWAGNAKAGEGRMTITESRPPERLVVRVEFFKPFAAINETVFVLTPRPAGVEVDWTMTGHNNFMLKAFSLFMNMDQAVGKDFEEGLAGLRRVAEAQAAQGVGARPG